MTDFTTQINTTAPPDVPTEHPYVVRTEGICGGRSRIKGSRISVRTIAELHKMGDSVEDILMSYPHLMAASVYDAISYYLDHREEIEAEIEANKLENLLEKYDAYLDERGIFHFRDLESE